MPVRQSPYGSPPFNPFRKVPTIIGTALLTILALALSLHLFHANRGYQITTVRAGEYVVETTLTRERVLEIMQQMLKTNRDTWSLRDVRLPNGMLVASYLDLETARQFVDSNQESGIIENYWNSQTITLPRINEANNYISVGIIFTYQEMRNELGALASGERDRVALCHDTTLPDGSRVSCALSEKEMENYTRRMHSLAADKILVQFFFSLDGIHPPKNTYRLL